jgi:nucleotide-binding universal stress UspA family protein
LPADFDWTLRRILVAVDGSRNALVACRLAASIAKTAKARIMLLYVVKAPERELRGPAEAALRSALDVREQQVVQEAASAIGDESLILEKKILSERASVVKAITTFAGDRNFDLIVLGTRGLGGFRRLTIGSVSSGVATHAGSPVLVVRSGLHRQSLSLKNIVVATDGSSNSKHAVAVAAGLAKLLKANLEILHVIHLPEIAYATTQPVPVGEMEEGARVSAEKVLGEAASLADAHGVKAMCRIKKGISPAQGIVDDADSQEADLIVVGARGLGGFRKLLLGSVSNSVLHYADCSVLVVK